MAGMAAQLLAQYMRDKEKKVRITEDGALETGWNINGGEIYIYIVFDKDDARVHFRGSKFARVPQEKYDKMYKVLNECNGTYSYIKFELDEKRGEVFAHDDAIIQLDSCGPECYEIIQRMVAVVEDALPKLMKVVWA